MEEMVREVVAEEQQSKLGVTSIEKSLRFQFQAKIF